MQNLKELSKSDLLATNGGGIFDDILGPLEDWLACNVLTGHQCPKKKSLWG